MKKHAPAIETDQFGFDALLAETDAINEKAAFEKAYAHLPKTMDEAVPHFCDLIARHHTAMLVGDAEGVMKRREEASDLAVRVNNGDPGILAGPNATGCRLAELTKAKDGDVPTWGQCGCFTLDIDGMRVRIDMDGMFGIGGRFAPWMNFSAHAVDWDKPFLSETGYRSFMGINALLVPGILPDGFAREVIATHIRKELKGKLRSIEERFRSRPKGQEELP